MTRAAFTSPWAQLATALGASYALAAAWPAFWPESAASLLGPQSAWSWLKPDPPKALALGIALALLNLVAWPSLAKPISRWSIQIGIVLMGFWISLAQVASAGVVGLALSAGAVVMVMGLSPLLAALLNTPRQTAALLSAGTAICGGSAIAATGAALRAPAATIALTTAIVFILNAIGVYAYPAVGHALDLTQRQYGAWCAIGVHDVAGVLAAAKPFGEQALADATIIKLTRVLWIAPVALLIAWHVARANATAQPSGAAPASAPLSTPASGPARWITAVPWFIFAFAGACALRAILERTFDPVAVAQAGDAARAVAGVLMTLALFLIGTALSRSVVRTIGWRPAAHAIVLWLVVSVAALVACRAWL